MWGVLDERDLLAVVRTVPIGFIWLAAQGNSIDNKQPNSLREYFALYCSISSLRNLRVFSRSFGTAKRGFAQSFQFAIRLLSNETAFRAAWISSQKLDCASPAVGDADENQVRAVIAIYPPVSRQLGSQIHGDYASF
jgi:hypothetical protein